MPTNLINFAWNVKEPIENKWKKDIILQWGDFNILEGNDCFSMPLNAGCYIEL